MYRTTGASFEKAQQEFATGVMSNKTVQMAAANAASRAAQETFKEQIWLARREFLITNHSSLTANTALTPPTTKMLHSVQTRAELQNVLWTSARPLQSPVIREGKTVQLLLTISSLIVGKTWPSPNQPTLACVCLCVIVYVVYFVPFEQWTV